MERASQEEQNGVNFSSVAPSSEELHVHVWVRNEHFDQNRGQYVVRGWFSTATLYRTLHSLITTNY